MRTIVLVIVALALASLAFASGSTEAPAAATATGNLTPAGTFPVAKEKETLTVFTFTGGGPNVNYETAWMTKFYEEKTNVKVSWITAPTQNFKEKVGISLASGEEIDIIFAANNGATVFSKTEQMKLGSQGAIQPINELIVKYSEWLRQALDKTAGWRDYITAPDGKIYGLPYLNECYHCLYYNKLFLNKKWLNKLGLKEPGTTAEFESVLKAFKTGDPNGNGQADEIPLSGYIGALYGSMDGYLMSAFVYCDAQDRLFIRDGKVVASFAQPEYREGLKWLNKLWNEGLMYKETFSQDRTKMIQLNSQKSESVIGAIAGPHGGYVGNRPTGEEPRWFEYIANKPLTGPSGLRTTRYEYFSKFGVAGGVGALIPASSKKGSLAMRWVDWFYSEEGAITAFYGAEGMSWEKPAPGDVGLEGVAKYKSRTMKEGEPYFGNVGWGGVPHYITAATRVSFVAPADIYEPKGTGFEKYLHTQTRDNYAPFGPPLKDILPPLFYAEADVQEISQIKTSINTYVEESMARFVTGDLKVDADWDKFLAELKKIGLDRYLQLVQKAYDSSALKAK